MRKLGTRKRRRLGTPPSQSPREGWGRGTAAPPGRRRVRGLFLRRKWGSARSNAGRGRPSPARACRDPTPVSGGGRRPADARGGVGAGERRGGENPQQNLRRSPSARLDLNGRSPRPRSAAETRESAVGRRGAAGTGRRRPGGPRAGTWLGSGLGLPALV